MPSEMLRELKPVERRTLSAAFGGSTLDAMDYMIFSFVVTSVIAVFGIDRGQAGQLATVTLLFSAVGERIAGILADRFGRVKILQVTILAFAVHGAHWFLAEL